MHINIEKVSHQYETKQGMLPVLNDLSLSIKRKGFTAIVGPSGCGKSTITRLVSGLIKPTEGSIFISNKRITSPLSTVGMAFQNPVLLEWRNVIKNIILPLEIVSKNMTYTQKRSNALDLLKLVGLEEFENNLPSELSGGMKQRVSLCRSLVHSPEVLILDEPFAALDAFTKEDLWDVMHKLKKERDFTCILITHDLREAVYLADQVIVLSGRPASLQYSVKTNFNEEKKISDFWIKKGLFKPKKNKINKNFSIVIPPPNITGKLHMGHALNNSLQDVLVRFNRMQGYETLWQPGTCLLYTSPSPRDQRGSRMPACA